MALGKDGYQERFRAEAQRRGVQFDTEQAPHSLNANFMPWATRRGFLDVAVTPLVEDRLGMTDEQFTNVVLDDAFEVRRRDETLRHPYVLSRWSITATKEAERVKHEQGIHNVNGVVAVPRRAYELPWPEFFGLLQARRLCANLTHRRTEAVRLLGEVTDAVWHRNRAESLTKLTAHDVVAEEVRTACPQMYDAMMAAAEPYIGDNGMFGVLFHNDRHAAKARVKEAGLAALQRVQDCA